MILSSLILFIACEKHDSVYLCNGLKGEPCFMYFKTIDEGYIFNNSTQSEKMTDEELNNPNYFPKTTDKATIYKTTDGGENWVKVDSILNYKYFDIATVFNNAVYILRSDEKEDFKFNIMRFNISNNNVKNLKDINSISSLWHDNENVFFTSNTNTINFYSLDKNQKLDSANIKDYVLSGLSLKNLSYAIFSNKERTYFGGINKSNFEIELPITPVNLVKQNDNTILIAGNTKKVENEISLVSFNANTKKSKIIKKFKNYSIVHNLQSNNKAIIGFIGNINGAFTEYDLLYSLDNGKNWQIKKLEEPNYAHPSCLVDNVVYIYSGGARMQKIIL